MILVPSQLLTPELQYTSSTTTPSPTGLGETGALLRRLAHHLQLNQEFRSNIRHATRLHRCGVWWKRDSVVAAAYASTLLDFPNFMAEPKLKYPRGGALAERPIARFVHRLVVGRR